MVSLSQIETDLVTALKAKDSVAANTLRGLKVRIQNEKISKMKDLSEDEIIALVKSEVKRRKEAAEAFTQAGRAEQAAQELAELETLQKYMPAQLSEEQLTVMIDALVTEKSFVAKDFGAAMGLLKTQVGQQADGSLIAKILKEKLK